MSKRKTPAELQLDYDCLRTSLHDTKEHHSIESKQDAIDSVNRQTNIAKIEQQMKDKYEQYNIQLGINIADQILKDLKEVRKRKSFWYRIGIFFDKNGKPQHFESRSDADAIVEQIDELRTLVNRYKTPTTSFGDKRANFDMTDKPMRAEVADMDGVQIGSVGPSQLK